MTATRYIVAGHFGTTLSYATIAKHIASGLAVRSQLAGTINFDDSYLGFDAVRVSEADMANARLLCITLPGHHAEQLAEFVGAERAILYMSPNTDTLSDEAQRVSWAFGGIVTPSAFCEYTVMRGTGRVSARVPLGVAPAFAVDITAQAARRTGEPPRFLHMSTDGFLPGRKGSEELLDAIAFARDRLPEGTRFTFHVQPSIQFDIRSAVISRDLGDIVDVLAGNARGLHDDELAALIAAHDVVVQPSRCEGFGITQLLPLVMGVPLATTYATGMAEFLPDFPGCWMPIRHASIGPLEGEDGLAPGTFAGEIADVLVLSASRSMRESMLQYQRRVSRGTRESWLWMWCVDRWLAAMNDSLTHR